MTEAEWTARLARCRQQLAPVAALVGEWEGRGQAHGEPQTGRLRLRLLLDDTVVEVAEQVGEHEDLCFYRWDDGLRQLRVLHLMAGDSAEHAVELTAAGLVWVSPPGHPAVEWSFDGELRCDVTWPGRKAPEVSMRYRQLR